MAFEWQLNPNASIIFLKQIFDLTVDQKRVFHVHGSFGDVYCQLSAIKETLLTNRDRSCAIIIDQTYSELANTAIFGLNAKILICPGHVANAHFTSLGILGDQTGVPTRLLPTIYPTIPELFASNKLGYLDFFRFLVGSSMSGPMCSIENNENVEPSVKEILTRGKSVIISADNNTHPEFPEEYWQKVIELVEERELEPVLNASGTISSEVPKLLRGSNIKKISIRPEHCVSTVKYAGYYIGSSNGFNTIQSLFNNESLGIHIINSMNKKGDVYEDKSGNKLSSSYLKLKIHCKNSFIAAQKEIEVSNFEDLDLVRSALLDWK